SGRNSDECRRLKDQHAHDLRAYRDNRTTQIASCRGYRPSLTAASSSENSNNDFYERIARNRGHCVEYPYVNCEQYDRYVHAKLHHHHHHHHYSDPPSGGSKPASASADRPAGPGTPANTGKVAKQDAVVSGGASHEDPTHSAHRASDRDNVSHHGPVRDSSSTAASGHGSGGGTHSGGS